MAEENQDGQEKTEEPTQRRLDKAAEEGRVLTSKEVMVFSTLAIALVLYLLRASFKLHLHSSFKPSLKQQASNFKPRAFSNFTLQAGSFCKPQTSSFKLPVIL